MTYEKNGKSYDFSFCQKIETLVDELKKFKEKAPFYEGGIGGPNDLPPNVGELTKEEIVAFYNKQQGKANWSRVIISASPKTDVYLNKSGKSFTLFVCQKLETLIQEVKKHQDTPLFCDRIDALPSSYSLNELTSQEITEHITNYPFYRNYTYLMVLLNK